VEKYGTAGQTTYDNMAHTHCMLDTLDYKHTLRNVIIIAFPLQQWLRERSSTLHLYVHCLSCCI